MFRACCSLVAVALLWGGTNPLLRRGGTSAKPTKSSNTITGFLSEVTHLATNWKFLFPFLINQCGSLLYFLTLADTDLSLAVPVANSLTFVFTALAGLALGEPPPSKGTAAGMLLITCGIILCIVDKM
ncbi:transmembrane protein 234 isoform X2 [Bacillus rossius redtenbacheri]|uniref:transmembrane protein 234 isoform X2 n=1 Tax=Bacillus rossius redtenbacheri TaxID=93214 RepID=UPI002FDE89B0